MRQRTVKHLDEKIQANSTFLVSDPCSMKGSWHKLFGNNHPIYLEIGCGKGQFILKHAAEESDRNFIAVEAQESVGLRTLEKAESMALSNLYVFMSYINDLGDYFEEGELSGIYLNFSDPWAKARQYKRRLTYRERLLNYRQVMKPGSYIEFKTDNEGLFEFTLEEVKAVNAEVAEMSRDLHKTKLESANFKTEYEDKFIEQGKNINYIKFR